MITSQAKEAMDYLLEFEINYMLTTDPDFQLYFNSINREIKISMPKKPSQLDVETMEYLNELVSYGFIKLSFVDIEAEIEMRKSPLLISKTRTVTITILNKSYKKFYNRKKNIEKILQNL